MKAKTFSKPNRSRDRKGRGLSAERKPREPVFPISREEIVRRCRMKPHDMLCAGEALALMDLMEQEHLTIKRLHELTKVSRSMIHDVLTMEAVMTNDTVGKLGRPFGMDAFGFHMLGYFTLRAEVSP